MKDSKIRVIIAKLGLDGHDRGVNVVVQGLRDAGMEVIYLGLRVMPEQVCQAAIQEAADVVGLSCHTGAHMVLFSRTVELFKQQRNRDALFIGGGIVPRKDIPVLQKAGIAQIFGPGTPIHDIADFIKANLKREDNDSQD
ncbi:MAG: methylmalonyl-CoA mutase [Chloroflexi bacterium]|nr:MAG: methylmalonyl-CoA mutase [Chloroflexota bacterium]